MNIAKVGPQDIAKLKEKALADPKLRSRVILHRDWKELTHEMVICAHHDTYIRAHRHPAHKTESYHIIEGVLLVFEYFYYEENGKDKAMIASCTKLEPGGTEIIRLSDGVWHQPVPKTEWVVYHEVYTGPWLKDQDVEYAPWTKEEVR